MFQIIKRYTHWLHTQWPSGRVEKLPDVYPDGSTAISGLYVVGDLTGIPLLKFSSDTGARVVQTVLKNPAFQNRKQHPDIFDLVIIGGGVSGMAAALEAQKQGLRFQILEASEPFSTLNNFPKAKPIYTYPTNMTPAGDLQFSDQANVKETLLDELQQRTKDIHPAIARADYVQQTGDHLAVVIAEGENIHAHTVIVAIGRSGNFRKLNVSGENLNKVYNRLHDPKDYKNQNILVVGGGDSALETATAIAESGGQVTLSYRGTEFNRPKPENIERIKHLSSTGSLQLALSTTVSDIREQEVLLTTPSGKKTIPNDVVFAMLGREAPLDFFRRSHVPIRGEWRFKNWLSFSAILLACTFIYHWKTGAGIPVYDWFKNTGLFPFNLAIPDEKSSFINTVKTSLTQPSFYYSLAYCTAVVGFGIKRIFRRKTPYVTAQTITLILIQCVPLFFLPYILLPYWGHNGWFDNGFLKTIADALFPTTEWDPHGREYWRVLGLILAWPLFVWNVFTSQPLWAWLVISLVQTFILIPLIVWRWGKGAYCGWICSCGALAETLGDTQRHKMPHGPRWNRTNMVGQVVLALVFFIFLLRLIGWALPYDHPVNAVYMGLFMGKTVSWGNLPFPLSFLNYQWFVDLFLAGIVGVGFYWHFSGRVWCRFACPLAALMHIYARFSRFRIFADKKKCISCNVCTSVCHQGIDVMNFANKGQPMNDPQCVRCSACVQSCPTGVLTFGQIDPKTNRIIKTDRLQASPVRMQESV